MANKHDLQEILRMIHDKNKNNNKNNKCCNSATVFKMRNLQNKVRDEWNKEVKENQNTCILCLYKDTTLRMKMIDIFIKNNYPKEDTECIVLAIQKKYNKHTRNLLPNQPELHKDHIRDHILEHVFFIPI
jgi:hypothetical protein